MTIPCTAGADGVIKEAAQMRNAAQAEMVLDETSEGDTVISYLSDLVQRAESQQAEQQRIVHHQAFLNLPRMVNEELALAKAEVSSFPCFSQTCFHCWVSCAILCAFCHSARRAQLLSLMAHGLIYKCHALLSA